MLDATRTTDNLSRLLELGFDAQPDTPVVTDAVRIDRSTERVQAECGAMGTRVCVTALGPSRERLLDAVADAFDEMDRLVTILSRYDRASALTELNAAGRLPGPPPELTEVVERALGYHVLTGGVFDVSVAPLVDLFRDRLSGVTPREPSDAEIREASALVGATAIKGGRRELRLARPGMRLTLDGIAKGFIVDRMAAVFDGHRVRQYLIDGGGDIRVRGRNHERRPWAIAVQDPAGDASYPDVIELADGAVATSGSYVRHYDAACRYHHIVDARTGRSPVACASVSIVARSTMLADALATSVFVMGPERGLAFVESSPGCECLIVDRDGRTRRSRGWKGRAEGGVKGGVNGGVNGGV